LNGQGAIFVFETSADRSASFALKTPHFIKYKTGTQNMVKPLELIETDPLLRGVKVKDE